MENVPLPEKNAQRIQEALLPGGEIVEGVSLQSLEQFGRFVDARPAGPEAKTVLFMKHHHGSAENAPNVLRSRHMFNEGLAHQDAVYRSLVMLADRLVPEDRLRVVIEALDPRTPYMSASYAESITNVQRRRDRFQLSVLDQLHQALLRGGTDAEEARIHMHGGMRFLARETIARSQRCVLPGRPPETLSVLKILAGEIRGWILATHQSGGVIDENEMHRIIREGTERYRADHEQRHAFVRAGLDTELKPGMLGVILYGTAHFRGGSSPVPFEEVFADHRSFTFEPQNRDVISMPMNDAEAAWIDPGNLTVDELQRIARDALRQAST